MSSAASVTSMHMCKEVRLTKSLARCQEQSAECMIQLQLLLKVGFKGRGNVEHKAFVAVHWAGPKLYMANKPYLHKQDGCLSLRLERMRAAVGHVVTVPYWEWDDVKGTAGSATRKELLLIKILQVGVEICACARRPCQSLCNSVGEPMQDCALYVAIWHILPK